MIYDLIIIGAGASGLFAASFLKNKGNKLILNKSNKPGLKILMSGSGQCNLTQSGEIKNFISKYGDNGSRIRKVLYRFNNLELINFFESFGVPLKEREDGKVFPKSLDSSDILNLLLSNAKINGFNLKNNVYVNDIKYMNDIYTINTENGEKYEAKKVIIATGGASYPSTGSDGNMMNILRNLEINIVPNSPALVPIFVENYKFSSLSGISFPYSKVSIGSKDQHGPLLLTHNNFSGPAILNISRYAKPGEKITIKYFSDLESYDFNKKLRENINTSQKQISTIIYDILMELGSPAPKRFIEIICKCILLDPTKKASQITNKDLLSIENKLFKDSYIISGTAGYSNAMVTKGGVSLNEINIKNFELKKYPGLYIIGEALDIDGDTGGYNLQFAFSSAFVCSQMINEIPH